MIYSGIPHPTAALFLCGSKVDLHERIIMISDDPKIDTYIREAGSWIFGHTLRILTSPALLFSIESLSERVIVIPTKLLKLAGNLEQIKRDYAIEIVRDSSLSQNTLIENLLLSGYHQSDYPGESHTYTREGSIIRIYWEDREYVIEYFDDTIESILEITGSARYHRERIYIAKIDPPLQQECTTLSLECISLIQDIPTLLIGCEFLREREILLTKFRDITEYSMILRDHSVRLDISLPKIESLGALLEYRESGFQDHLCIMVTRYEKKLQEFLEMNRSKEGRIFDYRHLRESFSLTSSTELLPEKWKRYGADRGFDCIADDIFSQIFIQNRVRKSTIKNLDLLLKIQEGDLVVHREHGIGKYLQMVKKRIGLIEREYLEIEYAGGDRVFVPMTELARLTKYVGDSDTSLSPLEGREWERTMSKTDTEIAAIAEEILQSDAKRVLSTRIPFGTFPKEEALFLDAFPYTHTDDQRSIIEDIRADMEGPHPMDRLIAGDVGFGKTEIAMNAVYKAVLSGVQVAVISPLLILAEEHRETFEERLGAFGVRVRSLTRMTHARDVKKILEEIKLGRVDVIVGTHRLLSSDIRFRRLGLLIIDEEHRFGVAQKEAIKKMKSHVDILSLSATPIPRSLHLALSGLKKISLLTTPPPSKKPIDTIVTRWEDHILRQAIMTELSRGGQVIILHNRVRSLGMIEREIEELMKSEEGRVKSSDKTYPPKELKNSKKQEVQESRDFSEGAYSLGYEGEKSLSEKVNSYEVGRDATLGYDEILHSSESPRIITTHGQMNPDDIEDRILAFKQRKYDILISTTVIENGVNFLGANTIIVSDAEEFGLAQLHQIRGRVGRKDIAGVCYLLYRKYELSSEERERLMILSEHSALGSGYEIAMRDMQMRGTGDVLGFRQSGKTKEVGISLYFQLLEEKIDLLKNGKKEKTLTKIDLELSYVINDEEFDSEMDKLSFFRDIESIETLEDLDITESTFGSQEMAIPMSNLFLMMRVSIILSGYGVSRLSKLGNNYHFDFIEGTTPTILRNFLERFDTGHEMIIVSVTKIKIETKRWTDARAFLLFLTH